VNEHGTISPQERLRHFRQAEQNQPTRKKQPRQFVPQEATLEQLTARLSTATTLAEKTQARHGLEQRRDLLAKRLAVAGSPTERLSAARQLEIVQKALAAAG